MHSLFSSIALASLLTVSACADSDDRPSPVGPYPRPDASPPTDASPPIDASVPDAASPTDADPTDAAPAADAAPDGPVTNHPNATITDVGALAFGLFSSAITVDRLGDTTYVLWHARLENTTGATRCFTTVDATFRDASGTTLFTMFTFLSGHPYQGAISLPIPCLAPGDTAFIATIDSFDEVIDFESIASIEYALEELESNVIPHPLAPTLVSSELQSDNSIAGVLRNDSSSPIYNLSVEVYPIQSNGLTFDYLFDGNLDTVPVGEVWNFETISYREGDIASYEIFRDFLPGTRPASGAIGPLSKRLDARAAERARDRALRERLAKERQRAQLP